MFFHVLVMNNYETCTDMYIIRTVTAKSMPCMYHWHIQTRIYNSRMIMNASISFIQCSDRVYTRIYRYLYVCLCAYWFRPCIYHVHTWHVQFHFTMNKKYKKKKILQRAGYEPMIMCITASCLNYYTTSMLASTAIVTVYVYCFT